MTAPLTIDIWSDVMCPWCVIGYQNLTAALDELGDEVDAQIRWLPFELNPDMPADGIERKAYRARKFGEARSAQLDVQMASTGRELGIEFAFDRMQRTPNTRLAHRLIWEADRQKRQADGAERGDGEQRSELAQVEGAVLEAPARGDVGVDEQRGQAGRRQQRGYGAGRQPGP